MMQNKGAPVIDWTTLDSKFHLASERVIMSPTQSKGVVHLCCNSKSLEAISLATLDKKKETTTTNTSVSNHIPSAPLNSTTTTVAQSSGHAATNIISDDDKKKMVKISLKSKRNPE